MIHKGANRYKVMQRDGVLPHEYQRVEYIENSYRQHIDTGWKNNYANDIYVEAYFKPNTIPSNANRCALLSNYNGSDSDYNFSLEARNNSNIRMYCYSYVTDTADNSVSTNIVNKVCIKYSSSEKYVSCNDSVVQIPYNLHGNCPNSNRIFVDKAQRFTTFCCYFKLYGMKIYDNGVLVRDFIPCYRKSDNEAGLYDTANDVFYTNQGTGSFIVGNNVYGGTFTVPERVEKKYYIRGTATDNFDFTLQYIDKNDNITTVTEHAVIDGNGKWETSYSDKKIYSLQATFKNNKKLTNIVFDNADDLARLVNLSETLYNCTNITSVSFKGKLLNSVTTCVSLFYNDINITNIDLKDAQLTSVTNTNNMFYLTKALQNLEISNLNIGNCYCAGMFNNMENLKNLVLPTNKTAFNGNLSNGNFINFLGSPDLTYNSVLGTSNWIANRTGMHKMYLQLNTITWESFDENQQSTIESICTTKNIELRIVT